MGPFRQGPARRHEKHPNLRPHHGPGLDEHGHRELFYYALQDNQELLDALFEKIGNIQLEIISRVIEHKCAGAILINDDIAHNSGLMTPSPPLGKIRVSLL